MKSLLELPEAYIYPEWRTCAVPGRPWWTCEKSPVTRHGCHVPAGVVVGRMARRDGAHGYTRRDDLEGWRKLGHGMEEDFTWSADIAWDSAQCIAHDAARPLPRPETRCGQIWAWKTAASNPMAANYPWQFVQIAAVGYLSFTLPTEFEALYLLYDPVRPDLAPWSSA